MVITYLKSNTIIMAHDTWPHCEKHCVLCANASLSINHCASTKSLDFPSPTGRWALCSKVYISRAINRVAWSELKLRRASVSASERDKRSKLSHGRTRRLSIDTGTVRSSVADNEKYPIIVKILSTNVLAGDVKWTVIVHTNLSGAYCGNFGFL